MSCGHGLHHNFGLGNIYCDCGLYLRDGSALAMNIESQRIGQAQTQDMLLGIAGEDIRAGQWVVIGANGRIMVAPAPVVTE